MRKNGLIKIIVVTFMVHCSIFIDSAAAEEVKIAVASNFLSTLNEIVSQFKQDTRHTPIVSSGSSGKLYAQITHGAPFDVFFSADTQRPQLLETEGVAVQGSRFTYAVGRLALWSSDPELITGDGVTILTNGRFEHLAMANPKTAPYGTAAKRVLKKLGLWKKLQRRVVYGENIAQTFQFTFSGNAQLGFVASSQLLDRNVTGRGSRWDVPTDLYEPIQQQAVLLKHGNRNGAAVGFLEYVQQSKAQDIIERFGYGVGQ